MLVDDMFTEQLMNLIHDIQQRSASAGKVKCKKMSLLSSVDKREMKSLHSDVCHLRDENIELQERLMRDVDVTLAGGDASTVQDDARLNTNVIHSQHDMV